MGKNDIKNELREIAPGIEKLRAGNPFQVPHNYFENLPQNIQEKIAKGKSKVSQPVFQRIGMPRFVLATIMTVLLVFAGYFAFFHSSPEIYLTESEEIFYENYLAWYSEYQPDVYYDILMANEEAADFESLIFDEDEVLDYLFDYGDYYMDYITYTENDFEN
ncbi:MAG: hypothetical protein EA393_12820 [Bacteroidetes bacterium]|nr:MAG: hypothetical protein EA393_12820 [Bacteroidota bacterium]